MVVARGTRVSELDEQKGEYKVQTWKRLCGEEVRSKGNRGKILLQQTSLHYTIFSSKTSDSRIR